MPIDANSSVQSDGSLWSASGANSRQKRVMPSRSRRGGPGLGHCEVDVLIIETQKRKFENEPLIPAVTPFLLTTNPKYAEEALNNAESGIQINVVANDRYFDRPDVLKAFREQAVIQTPEYEAISESISGVGGRFRPRNQEEAAAETSDAAYEKRHRKFENFEKRQRFREKEKLKHEHYKLKERIEQLKAMDGNSFMTLAASDFTPPPQHIAEDVEETPNSPYVSLNGGVYFVEGERRRKEMLGVATMLEQRYAYLLPPRKIPDASSLTLKDTESREGEETDTEQDFEVPASKKEKASKLRTQSVKSSASSTRAHSPASSRPLLSKKSLLNTPTLIPEPKRGMKRRTTISTSEPPDSIPSVEDNERSPSPDVVDIPEIDRMLSQPLPPPSTLDNQRSPSPEIIIVDDIPEGDRLSQPPPSSLQMVRNEKSPSPVDDITENDDLPPRPLSPLPTPLQLVQNEKSPSPVIEENDGLSSQALPPLSFLRLDRDDVSPPEIYSPEPPDEDQFPLTIQNGTQAAEDVSMEPESRPVDTDIEVEVSQPQPDPSPNMAHHIHHMENADGEWEKAGSGTENIQEPVLKPVRRRKKRRGRPRKIRTEEEEEEKKRGRQQEDAGPSRMMMEEEPEIVSGIRLEEVPSEIGLSDSISTRPPKRRRKNLEFERMSVPGRAQTPPLDLERGISATSHLIRGKTHVSYVDSRTGKLVCTPSLLIVACMRAMEKTHARRARDTISFGGPTPDFGKGAIVDYELSEEILYRDFRERSLTPSGSSLADITDEHEGSELEVEPSDDDNDAQEGQADDETESEAPDEQLSHERGKYVESHRGASEKPMEVVQSGSDQSHHGVKSPEQINYSRFGNPVFVYREPHVEPLVASPEAEPEPMPELPPGVRPREPSRRLNCDLEEELIW